MKSVSEIFIRRPKLAWAAMIALTLCGAICLFRTPVAEYPQIVPVTITVSCTYTGASATDLDASVGQILEDEINGVEDIWYYKSSKSSKGLYTCYCVFRPGTPSNVALMNVQNAVKRAETRLPTEVTQNGITVKKSPEDRMVMYCFVTDGREMDIMELSNFVEKQVADAISRVEGVGQVQTSGRTYAMRIWLDPVRLAGLDLSIDEIKDAILAQNVQAAAGSVGGEYANRYLNFKLNVKGRLKTKEEFENIVIRSNPQTGAQVLVKDVARVELGCKGYTIRSRFNDQPTVYFEAYKAPDANSVETAARVKKEVDKWISRLPKGVEAVLVDDSTAFTLVFLKETFKTLVIALLLVVAITYLFLQDARATFVPAIAIPISLLATFAVLYPLGYTLNVLTMFGLILVIGSLVDDAIVVVESCQSLMLREGLSAKEAAKKSMSQITGAIIATTLVTLACYLPLVFYSGMVGMMYVQFAVTMCVALCFSTVVALVLSPVLCAYLLKPPREKPARVFAPFNWTIETFRRGYLRFVLFFIRHALVTLLLFAAFAAALWFVSGKVPTAFLPKEDRGYIMFNGRLSEGQSLERAIAVSDAIYERIREIPGVVSCTQRCGSNGMWGSGENLFQIFTRLEHWDCRKTEEKSIDTVMARIREVMADFPQVDYLLPHPAAIKGLGGSAGVGFNFCSIEGCEPEELLEAADAFVQALSTNALVQAAKHGFTCSTPQLELKLDRQKVDVLGLTPKKVFAALQNQLASYYVNDFNIKGGVYQVKLQNDPDFRVGVADIEAVRIPTADGSPVPLASLGTIEYVGGTRETMSYNKMLAAWCDVTPAPGVSSSDLMRLIETTPKPKGFDVEWGPVQSQEKENEGRLAILMAFALVFAYLFLVALYESWTIPISVMLSVLFALVGAFAGLWLTKTDLSVYAQLGCVMLIGLAAKNAILMVEFSKQERARGLSILTSAYNGANLRFRAVQMTAWSFIIGVLPLALAAGAGAGAMKAIGVCTMSGMLLATFVGIVFVPALYAVFQRLRERFTRAARPADRRKRT